MRWSSVVFAFSLAVAAGPALAHHSIAAIYDRDKSVEVKGVVSKIELQNPHSVLEVAVPGADGRAVVWVVESRGVQGMTRLGFDQKAIAVGDKVTITGAPHRSSEHALWMSTLETAAGKKFDFSFRGRQAFGAP